MKQKIHFRLVSIALAAIIAAAVSTTGLYYYLFQKQVRADLKVNAELLSDTRVFDDLYNKDGDVDQEKAAKIFANMNNKNLRITWVDSDGTVLYDNDTDADNLDNHLDRPEIKEALENGSGESVRESNTLNMNTFYYALKLDNGTVIRVAMEARNITSVFLAAAPFIVLISIIIMAVCMRLATVMTRQLLKPIEKMAENIDDPVDRPEYPELEPFADKIRDQHEKILIAAKSQQDFTANVSHELKTPLTAISGYAELIENKMVPMQEVYFAKQIRENANRLVILINDIIKVAEVDNPELEREFTLVDLYQLAKNCCKDLMINAQNKGISLNYSGYSSLVTGNQELLREVIINLVQNAIRYNNPGGCVEVYVYREQGKTVLKVVDDGIGIPEDMQQRVFERFYRVDKSRSRKTGGTGLGLAIVKHIVELHNAEIKLTSEVGKGTMVVVRF